MIDISDKDRKAVLGEVLMDELRVIREYLEDLMPIKKDVSILKDDVAELKADVKIIKTVVTDHSRQLQNLDARVTTLEVAR